MLQVTKHVYKINFLKKIKESTYILRQYTDDTNKTVFKITTNIVSMSFCYEYYILGL